MNGSFKQIRCEADYEKALVEMKRLWGAKIGTPNGKRLDLLAGLIDAYESKHFPFDPPGRIKATKFRREQSGRSS